MSTSLPATLDEFPRLTGEWLRGRGPDADVVISSRIRLARNLQSFPFPTKMKEEQFNDVVGLVVAAFKGQSIQVDMNALKPVERTLLVERHLISRELANGEHARAVVFGRSEMVSIMINEEDLLPNGEVTRTGMGAIPGNNTWQLFKYNFGPYLDGLFSRSDLAIVTKIGMWIMPTPPAYKPFSIALVNRGALGAVIEGRFTGGEIQVDRNLTGEKHSQVGDGTRDTGGKHHPDSIPIDALPEDLGHEQPQREYDPRLQGFPTRGIIDQLFKERSSGKSAIAEICDVTFQFRASLKAGLGKVQERLPNSRHGQLIMGQCLTNPDIDDHAKGLGFEPHAGGIKKGELGLPKVIHEHRNHRNATFTGNGIKTALQSHQVAGPGYLAFNEDPE